MKDYEKKYKEALSRAATELETCGADKSLRNMIYAIFPDELKESEDEKIRKALLEMVHDTTGDELWVDYNVHKEEALAWLEKQGEQKQEWSEEDENMANDLIEGCISSEKAYHLVHTSKEIVDWLKSLKDRIGG